MGGEACDVQPAEKLQDHHEAQDAHLLSKHVEELIDSTKNHHEAQDAHLLSKHGEDAICKYPRTPSAKIRGRHLPAGCTSSQQACGGRHLPAPCGWAQDAHLLSKHVEEIIDNTKDSHSK
eukprot:13525342-Heterocapsa_arctica.AAC.1